MEVISYSKECNWYTRCCPLNGGVRYRESMSVTTCTMLCTCTYKHISYMYVLQIFAQ